MVEPADDNLALDLAAFIADHRRCGNLDTGFTGESERVWVACSCSTRIEREASPC